MQLTDLRRLLLNWFETQHSRLYIALHESLHVQKIASLNGMTWYVSSIYGISKSLLDLEEWGWIKIVNILFLALDRSICEGRDDLKYESIFWCVWSIFVIPHQKPRYVGLIRFIKLNLYWIRKSMMKHQQNWTSLDLVMVVRSACFWIS